MTETSGSPRVTVAAVRRLWALLPAGHRVRGLRLLCLATLAGLAEVVAIGTSLIFLVALSTPQYLLDHPVHGVWLKAIGSTRVEEVRLAACAALAVTALAAGALRIFLLHRVTGWADTIGAELDAMIFVRTIHQPYAVHIARHSSEVIVGVTTQSDVVVHRVLLSCLMLTTAALMMVIVLGSLVAWRPLESLGAFAGFAIAYGVIAVLTKRRLLANGRDVDRAGSRVVCLLQESLGGIRDVLIDATQAHYARCFAEESRRLRSAQASIQFLGVSPRYGIEALGLTLIAGLGALFAGGAGLDGSIAIIGALAVAAQRVLPMMQDFYQGYSQLTSAHAVLLSTLALLEQPAPDDDPRRSVEPLPFRAAVRLERVGFRYTENTPWVLRDVSLDITRGERIGIVGASGGGKSTLLDLLIGLQPPVEGRLAVDGVTIYSGNRVRWQAHIAQVPQAIHLSDRSVEENIALGVSPQEIDSGRVREAARKARIAEVIEVMPEGYRSRIGENGLRLSGGQRQRIGLARALYKQADVLVLDEATSALDAATEAEVIDTIEALGRDVTVIMVAHRLTTLSRCDRILRVEGGRLVPFDERVLVA
jgi:ABC-type bacteriocin/lantibiotic exporter with double-glycine peptidase domain